MLLCHIIIFAIAFTSRIPLIAFIIHCSAPAPVLLNEFWNVFISSVICLCVIHMQFSRKHLIQACPFCTLYSLSLHSSGLPRLRLRQKNISQIHACSFSHLILFFCRFILSKTPTAWSVCFSVYIVICVYVQRSYAYKLLLWYVGILLVNICMHMCFIWKLIMSPLFGNISKHENVDGADSLVCSARLLFMP